MPDSDQTPLTEVELQELRRLLELFRAEPTLETVDKVLVANGRILALVPRLLRDLNAARAEAARLHDVIDVAVRVFDGEAVTVAQPHHPLWSRAAGAWKSLARFHEEAEELKADNARLRTELERRQARSVTCCFCLQKQADYAGLKKHSATCPSHPLWGKNLGLRAALEALLSSPRFGNEPSEEAVDQARKALGLKGD